MSEIPERMEREMFEIRSRMSPDVRDLRQHVDPITIAKRFRRWLKEVNEEDLPGLRTFISYRRDESAGYAGRIADKFVETFGEDNVFRDIDSIVPGQDFHEAIESAVASSDVLVAVIGTTWLTATDAASKKRLEDPDDYVRIEIATALNRNILVIPLLIQGAAMPRADKLPEDLALLARRQAFELHDSSWREEVQRLMNVLMRSPVETTSRRQEDLELEVERLRTQLKHEHSRDLPNPLREEHPG